MTKPPKRPRDPNQLAKLIVDLATGTAIEENPETVDSGKDPAAVSLGRRGGLKGGRARADSLSPEQRSEIPDQPGWGRSGFAWRRSCRPWPAKLRIRHQYQHYVGSGPTGRYPRFGRRRGETTPIIEPGRFRVTPAIAGAALAKGFRVSSVTLM